VRVNWLDQDISKSPNLRRLIFGKEEGKRENRGGSRILFLEGGAPLRNGVTDWCPDVNRF